MKLGLVLAGLFVSSLTVQAQRVDVLVYGATPAGITAAVAAARQGESVLMVAPDTMVGGMMSGGLTKTDIGRRDTVGGLANEFFARVLKHYEMEFGKDSAQAKQTHGGIFFEPHVAEAVFTEMLKDAGVKIRLGLRISSVKLEGGHIASVELVGAARETVAAKEFVDASYEGDLMAAAHVPYRVGREAVSEYGESLAGVRKGPAELLGTGDHRVQSYNIRTTMTNRDDLRLPVEKPAHYMPEVFADFLDGIHKKNLKTFQEVFPDEPLWGPVNGKSDPNKADDVGANVGYAEDGWEARKAVYEHTRDVYLSFWYMLQNDPSLSEEFRSGAKKWGLPKDEFVASGHVSPQLYVREARRMVGRYVMSQKDAQVDRVKEDGVAIGSYTIDSHPVQMILTAHGLEEEGGHIAGKVQPYNIPYRSLTPVSPDNLLVVVDISATHIAYCTVRMEPVFMMLGQAGGLAAAIAILDGKAVQEISVPALREELKAQGVPVVPPGEKIEPQRSMGQEK